MTGHLPGPGLYLIDTSAFARQRTSEPVQRIIQGLVVDGLAATCATVDLETGYSGRNYTDVSEIARRRRMYFHVLPLSEEARRRARDVQIRLAKRGHHRAAGVIDLLTAAVAELGRATVLHYARDFEFIAEVTGQPQLWVAPPGTLD